MKQLDTNIFIVKSNPDLDRPHNVSSMYFASSRLRYWQYIGCDRPIWFICIFFFLL